jgi:hypothetical protein
MRSAGTDRNIILQQKGTYLVEDGGPVVNEAHARSRYGFRNGLGVVEVVFARLQERSYKLCWNDPGLMTLYNERTSELLRAGVGFHAHQARRHIGQEWHEVFPPACVFRPMPITDSGACRSPIPADADHRFQRMPITRSG